jgi:hypothetical protein
VKKSRPTKTVAYTRSEGKPPISPSSELGVSSGTEEEGAADDECQYCAGLFCEDQDGEVWVRYQTFREGTHCLDELSEKGL